MTWPFEPLEHFRYGVVYADPPWLFENWSKAGEHKSPDRHYDCLTLDALKALPVGHLASRNCMLFMWATFPILPDALELMGAWGFRYVTGGAWHKTTTTGKTAFGTGYVLRSAAELFLVGAMGQPSYVSNSERNLIMAVRREHSRKPDQAYGIIENLCPDVPKVELFSRTDRHGWDSWGDQLGRFTSSPEAA